MLQSYVHCDIGILRIPYDDDSDDDGDYDDDDDVDVGVLWRDQGDDEGCQRAGTSQRHPWLHWRCCRLLRLHHYVVQLHLWRWSRHCTQQELHQARLMVNRLKCCYWVNISRWLDFVNSGCSRGLVCIPLLAWMLLSSYLHHTSSTLYYVSGALLYTLLWYRIISEELLDSVYCCLLFNTAVNNAAVLLWFWV